MQQGTLRKFGIGCAAAALLLGVACRGGKIDRFSFPRDGVPESRGRQIIVNRSCGSCHVIPGVRAAEGMVGPPLLYFGRRTYIAGELPNNRENLVRWIRSPQSVEANTAMPNLGLSAAEAEDVAAYLYTLR